MWDIKDKICLITGATSGIGKETALAITSMGARVAITYRNEEKAEETKNYIYEKTGKTIETYFCDLSSLESIRNFTKIFLQNHDKLNVLINNAGIYETKFLTTKDGIESNFAINHLAPFLLTNLLTDSIIKSAPARIINVASEAHKGAKMNFEDLEMKNKFSGSAAYRQSKLANILFTKQLAIKLENTGVTVNCLHPGIVRTNIFSKMNKLSIALFKLIMISPIKGAKTSVYLASSDILSNCSGEYFKKKKINKPGPAAENRETAEKLWEISMDYIKSKNK